LVCRFSFGDARGVDHAENEEPFPLVGCSDLGSGEDARLNDVTQSVKVRDHNVESLGDVAGDVFEVDEKRSHCLDKSLNVRPKVPLVFHASPEARDAEGLAGISGSDAVYLSAKEASREGFNVRPDRSRVQESLFSFCNQVRGGVGFDLHRSDDANAWQSSCESEVQASVSGAKRDNSDVFGTIHINPSWLGPHRECPATGHWLKAAAVP
jgi:hypothetical protein